MNQQRRLLIKTVFELLDQENVSKIPFEVLMASFTANRAPEVVRKLRTEKELKEEFEYTFKLFYNALVPILAN